MPSGLSYKVAEGSETLEGFAWRCAAQFFHDCSTAPDKISEDGGYPEDYHRKSLLEDTEGLALILAMPDSVAKQEAEKSRENQISSAERYLNDTRLVRQRALEMKLQVDAWVAPSKLHEDGLKKLMLQQLDQLLKHDGDVSYYEKRLEEAESSPILSGTEWKNLRIANLRDSIKFTEKYIQEENAQIVEQNLWLKQLQNSLPRPEGV